MGTESLTLCPTCGRRVEPDEPGVKYALEQQRYATMGGHTYVDGIGAYFHETCSIPEAYKQVPKP